QRPVGTDPGRAAGRLSGVNNPTEAEPLPSQPAPAGLALYGWNERWSDLLAEHPGCRAGRVIRHDGSALTLATENGPEVTPLIRRLDPAPAVGDWVAVEGVEPVAVLARSSLLRRRAADKDTGQVLAAN